MSKVLLINGPKCSGKSEVAKELWKSQDHSILINLDSLKWMYSAYEKNSVFAIELAQKVALKMIDVYVNENLDVIIEKAFIKYQYLQPFVELSQTLNAKVYTVNIEAPLDILIERSQNRIHKTEKENRITSVKSIKDSYANYDKNKFTVDHTYNSANLSIKDIVKSLRKKFYNR